MSNPLQLRPTTTRVGRVVYDRPVHHFTERDVKRITSHLVENYAGDSVVDYFLNFLVDITIGLMRQILALVGLQDFAAPAVQWLVNIGNWIMAQIFDVFSMEYRSLMYHYATLLNDYNYQMYVYGDPQIHVSYYEDTTYG